jgi:hypothetical protein
MVHNQTPFARLLTYARDAHRQKVIENYADWDSLRKRIERLWSEHRLHSKLGMAVLVLNRGDHEMDVIITEYGWILFFANARKDLGYYQPNAEAKGPIEFICDSGEWAAMDECYPIASEDAERILQLWLEHGDIPL